MLTPEERAIFESVKKQVDDFEFHDDPPKQTAEIVRCINHATCPSMICIHKEKHRRNDLCEKSRCAHVPGTGSFIFIDAKCIPYTEGEEK